MRRATIAWRLSAMFAGVALLIFALVGIALQQVLRGELDRQQHNELDTKFRIGAQLVEHCTEADKWHFVTARLDGLGDGDAGSQFWVLSEDPRFRYGDAATLAALQEAAGGRDQRDSRQAARASLIQPVAAAGARPEVRLAVAIDARPYRHTLRSFAAALASLSAFGIALAALLGHSAARLGLAPLARLSHEAQALSPRHLAQRLQLEPLPSELSELAVSFNGALDRLERAYLQLQAFNADVAHELRTPLTNLIGQTEVALARKRSPDELEDVLQSNLEELDRLRAIVNDMLFLARVDQGARAETLSLASLAAEVGKTLDFMDVVLDEAGLQVEVEGDAQASIDTALFRRAVTNLLQNAVQYAPAGAQIRVRISTTPGGARIAVSNPGAPIAAGHLQRLFDRFYRVDPSRGSGGANHGLGLAIVKAVATMHGGAVFASSEAGFNTVGFTVARSR
jgi:two-component system heavy metal sensor histidine kinase CusS